MNFPRAIFSFILLFSVQIATAQGGASIRAKVDKNRILIGEPVQLTVEIHFSPGSVKNFRVIDSIEHFEILKKPVIDSTNEKGVLNIKGVYTITSFDSGHWVIPPFILSSAVKTDPIPMDVVFSAFDPGQDYHGIKDIIEVAPPKTKRNWWYIAAAVILLAGAVVYLLRKKKSGATPAPAVVTDPYKEAMEQLELLQSNKPASKKYYSDMTGIFRLYVFRKKGILSLQETTADLVAQLGNFELGKEQFDRISQALRLSDFVKFAKYVPTSDDDKNCFEEIKNSIMAIEKSGSNPPTFGGS